MHELEIPMTQTIPAAQVRQNFAEIMGRVYKRQVRVLVERNGMAMAVIISPADFERFTGYEEAEARRLALVGEVRDVLGAVGSPSGGVVEREGIDALRRMRERFADVPEREIEEAVATAVGEVRQELRAGRSSTGASKP